MQSINNKKRILYFVVYTFFLSGQSLVFAAASYAAQQRDGQQQVIQRALGEMGSYFDFVLNVWKQVAYGSVIEYTPGVFMQYNAMANMWTPLAADAAQAAIQSILVNPTQKRIIYLDKDAQKEIDKQLAHKLGPIAPGSKLGYYGCFLKKNGSMDCVSHRSVVQDNNENYFIWNGVAETWHFVPLDQISAIKSEILGTTGRRFISLGKPVATQPEAQAAAAAEPTLEQEDSKTREKRRLQEELDRLLAVELAQEERRTAQSAEAAAAPVVLRSAMQKVPKMEKRKIFIPEYPVSRVKGLSMKEALALPDDDPSHQDAFLMKLWRQRCSVEKYNENIRKLNELRILQGESPYAEISEGKVTKADVGGREPLLPVDHYAENPVTRAMADRMKLYFMNKQPEEIRDTFKKALDSSLGRIFLEKVIRENPDIALDTSITYRTLMPIYVANTLRISLADAERRVKEFFYDNDDVLAVEMRQALVAKGTYSDENLLADGVLTKNVRMVLDRLILFANEHAPVEVTTREEIMAYLMGDSDVRQGLDEIARVVGMTAEELFSKVVPVGQNLDQARLQAQIIVRRFFNITAGIPD